MTTRSEEATQQSDFSAAIDAVKTYMQEHNACLLTVGPPKLKGSIAHFYKHADKNVEYFIRNFVHEGKFGMKAFLSYSHEDFYLDDGKYRLTSVMTEEKADLKLIREAVQDIQRMMQVMLESSPHILLKSRSKD